MATALSSACWVFCTALGCSCSPQFSICSLSLRCPAAPCLSGRVPALFVVRLSGCVADTSPNQAIMRASIGSFLASCPAVLAKWRTRWVGDHHRHAAPRSSRPALLIATAGLHHRFARRALSARPAARDAPRRCWQGRFRANRTAASIFPWQHRCRQSCLSVPSSSSLPCSCALGPCNCSGLRPDLSLAPLQASRLGPTAQICDGRLLKRRPFAHSQPPYTGPVHMPDED